MNQSIGMPCVISSWPPQHLQTDQRSHLPHFGLSFTPRKAKSMFEMGSPQRRAIACTICAKAKTKCDKIMPSCSRCTSKGLKCEGRPSRRASDAATRQMKKQNPPFKKSLDLYPLRSKDEPPFRPASSTESAENSEIRSILMDGITSSPVQEPATDNIPDPWQTPSQMPLLPPGYDYALPQSDFDLENAQERENSIALLAQPYVYNSPEQSPFLFGYSFDNPPLPQDPNVWLNDPKHFSLDAGFGVGPLPLFLSPDHNAGLSALSHPSLAEFPSSPPSSAGLSMTFSNLAGIATPCSSYSSAMRSRAASDCGYHPPFSMQDDWSAGAAARSNTAPDIVTTAPDAPTTTSEIISCQPQQPHVPLSYLEALEGGNAGNTEPDWVPGFRVRNPNFDFADQGGLEHLI